MNSLLNTETTFFLVIVILFSVILILFLIIGALLYYFTKAQKNLALGPIFENKNKSAPASIEKPLPLTINRGACFFHEQNYSQGLCAICEKSLCELCVKSHDKLLFCPDHYQTFLNHKWEKLETIKTTPETPMEGIELYTFKHHIWNENETPTYLITHYAINVENDLIESYVTLFVREQELQILKDKFLSQKLISH